MSRPVIYAAVLGFYLLGSAPAVAFEAPEEDRAGNRIEAFEAIAADSAVHCTPDRQWCAQIHSDAQDGSRLLEVFDQTAPVKERPTWRYALPKGEDYEEGDPPTFWPRIVRLQAGDGPGHGRHSAMMGVVMHFRAGYSGGGASADHLVLIKVDAGYGSEATFAEVLSVPLSGAAMIRACFSDADVEQRAGACHDEYSFSATLTLHDADASAGLPEFSYETEATSFPGPVSRNADSLANPALKESDLVTVVNQECSYSRILRFNPAIGRYEADSPLPDCSEFTAP
ncbi:hypothetical protein [Lysobacter tyrosinilyticus]